MKSTKKIKHRGEEPSTYQRDKKEDERAEMIGGKEIGAIIYVDGWSSRETRTAPLFLVGRLVDIVPGV